jgi:hypothetical protein
MSATTPEHFKPFAELTADERLRRKIDGNGVAAELRRISDRQENAPFRAHLLAAINTILVQSARTPEKDRTRVRWAMREFGGGEIEDIALYAKLPEEDTLRIVAEMCAAGEAKDGGGGLYFLKDS